MIETEQRRLIQILRIAAVPLILLAAFLIFIGIYQLFGLPSSNELVEIAQRYYSSYGYWVVFLGALVEGVLVINWYLPGSFVVVLGMLFARQGSLNPIIVVGLVVMAFCIDIVLNYALGRYGWYKLLLRLGLASPLERMRRKVVQHGLPLIFSTYFHPNVGALTAASCGILHLPFDRFLIYSILALIGWNSLWGAMVYMSGPAIMKFLNMWLLIPALVLWTLIVIVRSLRQADKKPS